MSVEPTHPSNYSSIKVLSWLIKSHYRIEINKHVHVGIISLLWWTHNDNGTTVHVHSE